MVSGKFYILGLALTVMGCQTQSTLSLDEAKQVSTKFEGAAFVAPPRTVEDITKIIDQQKIDDPEKNARLQKVAKQAVPKNASKNELMDFYWERGKAANELGFAKQALNDSRNTARLWQEIGQRQLFIEGGPAGCVETGQALEDAELVAIGVEKADEPVCCLQGKGAAYADIIIIRATDLDREQTPIRPSDLHLFRVEDDIVDRCC